MMQTSLDELGLTQESESEGSTEGREGRQSPEGKITKKIPAEPKAPKTPPKLEAKHDSMSKGIETFTLTGGSPENTTKQAGKGDSRMRVSKGSRKGFSARESNRSLIPVSAAKGPIEEGSYRNLSFLRNPPPRPPLLTQCPICLAPTKESHSVEYRCGHKSCVGCGMRYLQEQIEEIGEANPPCPAHHPCREEIHPNIIRYLLRGKGLNEFFSPRRLPTRKRIFREYEFLSVAKALAGDREVRWCPGAGCRYAVLVGKWRECCPLVVCDMCELKFCGVCGTRRHPGRPCPPVEDITQLYPDIVRRCPTCQVPHARKPGCNYGQCANRFCGEFEMERPDPKWCEEKVRWKFRPSTEPGCKTRFCWSCSEEVTTLRHYSIRKTKPKCNLSYNDVVDGFWLVDWYMTTPFSIVCMTMTLFFLLSLVVLPLYLIYYIPKVWYQRFSKRREMLLGHKADWKKDCRKLLCQYGFIFLIFGALFCSAISIPVILICWGMFYILNLPCFSGETYIRLSLSLLDLLTMALGSGSEHIGILQTSPENQKREEFIEKRQKLVDREDLEAEELHPINLQEIQAEEAQDRDAYDPEAEKKNEIDF